MISYCKVKYVHSVKILRSYPSWMHKENAIRKQLTGGGVALIHYTSTYQTRSPLLKWGQQSGQPYFPPFKKLLFRENYHVPDSTSSPFQLTIVILNNKCSVPWPQNFCKCCIHLKNGLFHILTTIIWNWMNYIFNVGLNLIYWIFAIINQKEANVLWQNKYHYYQWENTNSFINL